MSHWQITLSIKLVFQSILIVHEYFQHIFVFEYVLYLCSHIPEIGMYSYLKTL